jgi:hypothetical protein
VPESELPVLLPRVKNFRPEGTGTSPLASVKSFYETACPKCGEIHVTHHGRPSCSAHISSGPRKGLPCRKAPVTGADKCATHGLAKGTPARAAVERRTEEDRIATKVGDLLDQVAIHDQHPIDGLLEAVDRTGNIARILARLANDLDLRPQLGVSPDGTIGIGAALYGPDHNLDGRPHVLMEMLRVWTELHAKACKLALDAGIDERRLQLEENEVDQLMEAVMVGLAAAGLDAAQQARFTAAFAPKLRELGG